MTDTEIESDEEEGVTKRAALRTPLYRAMNAERYGRQQKIRDIQETTGARLICYLGGLGTSLTRDDVLPLVDMLDVIPTGEDIDLLLHTPGGEIDAAEKMAGMIRKHVGDAGCFRVIVPDFAKSAGTLITLAADTVVMSDSSELGPVDPQLYFPDGDGRHHLRPAQSYLDGYEDLVTLVNEHPEQTAHRQMLDKYDPTMVDVCRKVIERSRKLAEELLRSGMHRSGGNFTALALEIANNRKWLEHSVPIDSLEAKRLGLNVTYLEPTDPAWRDYWALYCEQRLALRTDNLKLFESDYVSIPIM